MTTAAATLSRGSGATAERRRWLVPTLSLVVLTVAILQTAVVPALDVIAGQLNVSASAVSWAVTANLLAAAAGTPLIGRIADLRDKKRVLLTVMTLVSAGSALAATTASLPLLLTGRVLQGLAFALYPVAVSILRDEVPADRLVRSMAVISAMLGLGGVVGLVAAGAVMTDGANYQRIFWLCTAVTAATIVPAAIVLPDRARRGCGEVDWSGALGLAAGLSAVLLALTQGRQWGWNSPATLITAVAGVGALAGWWSRSRRMAHPLVSTRMLARRPVLLANTATLLVGMGLYFSFLGVTDFVKSPPHSGFGFGASVLTTSLEFLLPGAAAAAATALVSGRLIERFGAHTVVVAGASAGAVGFSMLVEWHSAPWQVISASLLTNAYISLAYGALPILVIREVGHDETAVATSLNAIVRQVGAAIAAALVAVLLSEAPGGHAAESSFGVIFTLGAATAIGTILLIRRH
jgi:predicted MFS family arabinose efflux permease